LSFIELFNSIQVFTRGKKLIKKYITVSDVKNLERDDSDQMFTIIQWKNLEKMKLGQNPS